MWGGFGSAVGEDKMEGEVRVADGIGTGCWLGDRKSRMGVGRALRWGGWERWVIRLIWGWGSLNLFDKRSAAR